MISFEATETSHNRNTFCWPADFFFPIINVLVISFSHGTRGVQRKGRAQPPVFYHIGGLSPYAHSQNRAPLRH